MTFRSWFAGLAPLVLLGTLSLPADAQRASVNARLREQRERIEAGVRSGQLTRAEAKRLYAQDVRISWAAGRARISGGRMTARERRRLEERLARSSAAIRRERHDRRHRR